MLAAAGALAVLLTALSQAYGFERDELYFRMLPPAWGYVDQPPLVPLLARLTTSVADQPWAMRVPATLVAAGSVLVVSLVTRELGGSRAAQVLSAWGYAGTSAALVFGHVLVTSTFDVLLWPLICLFVMRALLRGEARWWLFAGVVAGAASYDKLLVSWLLLGIAVGLLLVGPRRVVWSPPALAGAGLTFVIALPNLIYQVTHSWPQLEMGAALARNNAGSVRGFMWVILVLVLGPPLVAVWVAGIVALLRRPEWRPVQFLVPAFAVVVALTFVAGTQPYYPTGLLIVLYAAGMVPAAELSARSTTWRVLLVVALAVNAAVSAVVSLPVLPVRSLGASPVPALNLAAADSVGWPMYVAQVARVYHRDVPAAERPDTVVVTSNYGEAGAVARFGPSHRLPRVFSGQNALYPLGPPPTTTRTVVFVGYQLPDARPLFHSCRVRGHLDNLVGVDNEEQQAPVAVCVGPREPWPRLWPRLHHLD